MKKIYKFLSISMICTLFFTACDQDETTFDALEFPADAFVAFAGTSVDVLEASTQTITITVNRATSAADAASALSVPFTITTSAVLDVDYTIVGNKTSFDFAEGEYVDTLQIETIDNTDEDGNKEIVIALTKGNGIGFPGSDANGSSFTLNINDDDCAFTLQELGDASWSGTDNASAGEAGPNESLIETSFDGTNLLLEGIAYAWLTDTGYWNEPIVVSNKIITQVDPISGLVTIDLQDLCETTYLGDPQPAYSIVGSGQYTSCSKTLVINYDLIQGGGVLRSFTETLTF